MHVFPATSLPCLRASGVNAQPREEMYEGTLALAMDVNPKNSNQLDRNATYNVGQIYAPGDRRQKMSYQKPTPL